MQKIRTATFEDLEAYNPAPVLSAVPEMVQFPVRIPGVKPLGWYLAPVFLSGYPVPCRFPGNAFQSR